MTDDPIRCAWATTPLGIVYHDREWGVPVHDDRRLFEMLVLEGAQAGLSWETILRKRERYREVFDEFDPARVARYGPEEVERLLSDPGVVRHRGKIEAAIKNARALLDVREELGSFDAFVWSFVGGRPRRNDRQAMADLPAKTPESEAISRELRRRGFRFVGPTICYAFMQAVGLVNDHTTGCFRHAAIGGEPW
jgi:DNA-3-methyladenine glycosylase I